MMAVSTTALKLRGKVRDVIRDHPERHDQSLWFSSSACGADPADVALWADRPVPHVAVNPDAPVCQTTACVAGWAAIMAAPKGSRLDRAGVILIYGEYHEIGRVATDALELYLTDAGWLFAGDRSRDEVVAALDILADDPDGFEPGYLDEAVEARIGDDEDDYDD
jgi:hypothetical protein